MNMAIKKMHKMTWPLQYTKNNHLVRIDFEKHETQNSFLVNNNNKIDNVSCKK